MAEGTFKINDSYPLFMSMEFTPVVPTNWRLIDSYPLFMNMQFNAVTPSAAEAVAEGRRRRRLLMRVGR